jgi:uncharacterized protein (DUF2141 family)
VRRAARLGACLAVLAAAGTGAGARAADEPAATAPGTVVPGAAGALKVHVQGLRNEKGQLLFAVFGSAPGFPSRSEEALATRIVERHGLEHTVVFRGLPPGEYAVSFVHDENGNGRLDKNILGIPKEGFGVSNNVRPRIGAPAYRDAKLAYDGGERTLEIRAIYY